MDKMDDYYLLEHFNLEEDKNEENKKKKIKKMKKMKKLMVGIHL